MSLKSNSQRTSKQAKEDHHIPNATRLIINLDRSHERLIHIQRQFEVHNLSFERVPAVDALNIAPQTLDNIRKSYSPFITKELSTAEIACFMSHMKCWQLVIDRKIKGAFIFEDDIALSKEGIPLLISENWIPENVDICQLGTCFQTPKKVSFRKIRQISERFVITQNNTRTPVLGTQGYWISSRGAKIALKAASKGIPGPVDHFLFDPKFDIPHTLNVWTLSPAIAFEEKTLNSTIATERNKTNKCPVSIKNLIKIWWRKKTGKMLIKTLTRELAK